MGDGLAGAIALAALAATAALAVLCFVKVVGLVRRGPPRRAEVAAAVDAPREMRAAALLLAAACVVLGIAPGLLLGRLAALAPWPAHVATTFGLHMPGTGSLPTPGLAIALPALTLGFALAPGRRGAAPAPTWVCGQRVGPALPWTSAGVTTPLQLARACG